MDSAHKVFLLDIAFGLHCAVLFPSGMFRLHVEGIHLYLLLCYFILSGPSLMGIPLIKR